MEQDKLIEEFKEAFNQMSERLGVKSSLDELDEVFYLSDMVLRERFISSKLSRVICARIRDTFNSWIGHLHSLLVPIPSSMIGVSESKVFNEEEKKRIVRTIETLMAFTSENNLIGLTKDKEKEAEYIDNSLIIWGENKEFLIFCAKKIHDYWKQESLKK